MEDLEAIGEAVTGGVVARAVEPNAGDAGTGEPERACLNCSCALVGDFCHCCGQQAHVHRTMRAFGHDLLHGALHFEGKVWRTLPLLVWRPGELTRRYIDGQRASFVSPIALFLFCVFLMFAVMGLSGALSGAPVPADARAELASELADAREAVAELEAERAEALRERAPVEAIDARIREARRELAAVATLQSGRVSPIQVDQSDEVPGWLRGWVGKAGKNPELLFYKFKTNAYKFSWALIPISVPFVWLLFPFSRRFGMYDHTIFVTYSLCFMMLLLMTATTLGLVLPALAAIAWLVPPIHMYRQLKGTYGVGRAGALWRTAALTMFAFIAVALFTSLLVGVGEVA